MIREPRSLEPRRTRESQSSPGSVAETNPDAPGEMAAMFDQVSGRYDLLNTIMSLGQDASWRRAMWSQVPAEARVVLDLCTGNGVSLEGLRRPGRLVIGLDLSLVMLEQAADTHGRRGWAPRLLCGDAFRIPLRSGSVDCVTVAFGVRNFRPRQAALVESARVLGPGGKIVVLEATAPGSGLLAPLHRFYVRRVIPFAGRISSKPEAYQYLSRSILEFGSGPDFEAELEQAGFVIVARQSFLFGATHLWVAGRVPESSGVQTAWLGQVARGEMRTEAGRVSEWRWWNGVQILTALAVLAALVYAAWKFAWEGGRLPLEAWQRRGMWVLLVLGLVGFLARMLVLLARFLSPPPRR